MLIIYIIVFFLSSDLWAFESTEIAHLQRLIANKPVGERIAFWADKFVGTPYDTDPLGEYVRKEVIVSDERVDCMYHVFRSTELALSNTPQEAIKKALDLRFHSKGIIRNRRVINYDDRFQYGIDMILSNKWGRDVTEEFGRVIYIKGARGLGEQKILPKEEAIRSIERFKSGDIVFFIKDPQKRIVGEIVGHIGIIKVESSIQDTRRKKVYLIHASGHKRKFSIENKTHPGRVKKVDFLTYLKSMPFIGIKVTRFGES